MEKKNLPGICQCSFCGYVNANLDRLMISGQMCIRDSSDSVKKIADENIDGESIDGKNGDLQK